MSTPLRRGFTLIELLVAMSIAALLLVLAAPNYARWVADAQTGGAANTLADGLRFAQAEAIKRNTSVEFVLDPTTGTGGWLVQLVGGVGGSLKVMKFAEGSLQTVFVPAPAGSTTVTFNSLGGIQAANANAPTAPFTTIGVSNSLGVRPLTILVGGTRTGVKICDPNPNIPVSDPKGCPALGG